MPTQSWLPRSTQPVAICVDPLRALGWRGWQRQVEERDRLSQLLARADRDDLVVGVQVHALDRDVHTQHLCLEWNSQLVFDHGKQAGDLLALVVAIDGGLLDHRVELCFALRSRRATIFSGPDAVWSRRVGCNNLP